jgi:hypothetical protein
MKEEENYGNSKEYGTSMSSDDSEGLKRSGERLANQ